MAPSIEAGRLTPIRNIFDPALPGEMLLSQFPMNEMPLNQMSMHQMPFNEVPQNAMQRNDMPPNEFPMNDMTSNKMPFNGNNMPSNEMLLDSRRHNSNFLPPYRDFSVEGMYNPAINMQPESIDRDQGKSSADDKMNQKDANLPDYDQIIGQKFPQAVNLLERLKEMNKLKDEQKKKEQKEEQGGNAAPITSQGQHFEVEHKKPSGDKEKHKNLKTPSEEAKHKKTHESPKSKPCRECKHTLKEIKKRKFYSQAEPVRPQNEIKRSRETIYYLDY